jgi:hypothetical protein
MELLLIIQAFVFGFFTQALATSKGHTAGKFFWIGFFFSFLGLLFVMGIPTVATEKRQVAAPVKSIPPPPPPPSRGIYVHLNDKVQGPFSAAQIEAFLQVGTVTLDTQCCIEGSQQWQPVRTLTS